MSRELAIGVAASDPLRCIVWLHGETDPTPTDWQYAMEQVRQAKLENGGVSRLRFLVVTDGGAPNAPQRTELFRNQLEGSVRCAAVSTVLDNPIKRGIVTAITWLHRDFKAVPPEQFESALIYLGIAHIEPVWTKLCELQSALPLNRTLSQVAAHLELDPRA